MSTPTPSVIASRPACARFPLCDEGGVLPDAWTPALAWQVAHRGLGALVLLGVLTLGAALWRRAGRRGDRRLALLLAAAVAAEVLLGGANVWLGVPPWASAAHLGLAAAIFGLLAHRVIAGGAGPTTSAPAAVSAMQR